jgi:hypothetical protein
MAIPCHTPIAACPLLMRYLREGPKTKILNSLFGRPLDPGLTTRRASSLLIKLTLSCVLSIRIDPEINPLCAPLQSHAHKSVLVSSDDEVFEVDGPDSFKVSSTIRQTRLKKNVTNL